MAACSVPDCTLDSATGMVCKSYCSPIAVLFSILPSSSSGSQSANQSSPGKGKGRRSSVRCLSGRSSQGKSLTKTQIMTAYKAELREYRLLQEELGPWTQAFKAQHGRKPGLLDVERTGMCSSSMLLICTASGDCTPTQCGGWHTGVDQTCACQTPFWPVLPCYGTINWEYWCCRTLCMSLSSESTKR